ncbi:Hypothetical protein BN2458_PEG0091 [Helicobacter typhlonius]|uniref:Uncharacterized protein n=1 Tax=Helicobacter typhlonius TaxID=76936 RepID=A0A0S4PUT2_9HELI|nr:Hypothetical protein BN2458_PEG0091 [Helicobacter typhlonius]
MQKLKPYSCLKPFRFYISRLGISLASTHYGFYIFIALAH